MRSTEKFIIATNHPLDQGGAFPREFSKRGIAFDIVDLNKRFPSPTQHAGIIALGSPQVNTSEQVAWYGDLIKANTPGIGICVSHQGMGEWLGGTIGQAANREIGFLDFKGEPFQHQLTEAGLRDPVLRPASQKEKLGVLFEFHNAAVAVNPRTTEVLSQGEDGTVQALRAKNPDGSVGPMLGVQFHPELETEKDLETFLQIYQKVFTLGKDNQNKLREQHAQYKEKNVGLTIVRNVIDVIAKSSSASAA